MGHPQFYGAGSVSNCIVLEEALTAYQVNNTSRAGEVLEGVLALISGNIREDMIEAPAVSLSDLCRDFIRRL